MNWKALKLKEMTSKIGSGATPRGGKNSYKESGISLVRSLNVYDFKFETKNLAYIDEKQAGKLANVTLEENDILLNITGASVARCTIIPDNILPARVNQHVSIIRIKKNIADPYFVLYSINSDYYKHRLLSLAQGGATREALTKEMIEKFEIKLPPLPTQQKIASILFAYDDLIENNNRRIAILEDMAQKLYREWFVKFRFPGHKDVKMVDSELGEIPEGWEVVKLSDIAKVNPESITARTAPESIKYVDISSVGRGKIDNVKEMLFSEAPSRARRKVTHQDIIWATVRPNRKQFAYIVHPDEDTIVSTGFAVIRAEKVPSSYLYFTVTADNYVSYLVNNATGSAYPAVNVNEFKNSDILKPSDELLEKYTKYVDSLLTLIKNLSKKNQNLKQQRDLLLPKLISGKINV